MILSFFLQGPSRKQSFWNCRRSVLWSWTPVRIVSIERKVKRRFTAVSPFCFGYPTQSDIVSLRLSIIAIPSTNTFLSHGRFEVSWGFLLHASGLSFGLKARGSSCGRLATQTNLKDADFRSVQFSDYVRKGGMDRKEPPTSSIDRRAVCMVDLMNLSWAVLRGRQCGLSSFCAGWPLEWVVIRLPRVWWTPAQDSWWSWKRRLDNVDLLSVFTIS